MATSDQLLTSRVLLARASVMLAAQPLGALLANANALTLCFVRMTCVPALATSKRACLYGPHNKLQDMALTHCKEHISLTLKFHDPCEDGVLVLPALLCASVAHS